MFSLSVHLINCMLSFIAILSLVQQGAFGVDVFFVSDYDRNIRPGALEGLQVDASFDTFIHKMGPIEEADMQMSVDIYFRQYWKDERLIDLYTYLAEATNASVGSSVQMGIDYMDLIWFPDIYWVDALLVSKPGVHSRGQSLELDPEGSIFFSSRLLINFRCEMDLTYFPFDIQECHLCFESYLYNTNHQNMTWTKSIVSITTGQTIANFYIEDKPSTYTKETTYALGTVWKQLCIKMVFPRKLAIYVITMFLPSIALVVLSWVGFWVDKKAVPARSGLSITTILATITLINGNGTRFPGVADLKMGDLYLIVNFFYVFATLVEFALVSYKPPPRAKWKMIRKEKFLSTLKGFTKLPGSTLRLMNLGKLTRSNNVNNVNNTPTTEDAAAPIIADDGKTVKSVALLFGGGTGGDKTAAATPGQNNQDDNSKGGAPLPNTPMPRQKSAAAVRSILAAKRDSQAGDVTGFLDFEQGPKEVEFNGEIKEDELHKVTKFDYWSAGNADEICKWFFPSTFIGWNLAYFFVTYTLSGRW
ncbi:glycine receptor subunit alphaZ1-like [Convolutriloba macropyga]|uniref:glycine receptor subunit alphaZ1-like n=1 Tax=Convolutriloba macropyga TaxID=536237 RepID=UPI003F5278DD